MATKETKDVAVQEKALSTRFMEKVVTEYGSGVGSVVLSPSQKRMAQNYFIVMDEILRAAETKRYNAKNDLPYGWNTVNMEGLARNVVSAVRVGLDPLEKNMIHMIPYKNGKTKKYDIGFIPGYRGLELKARKYGLDVPTHVVVEVVHANDDFEIIKKDAENGVENYLFKIKTPFDRGDVVGGFYAHKYQQKPYKDKVVVLTLDDILKRKPKYASAEFWGGKKDVYEKGKKVGMEELSGWFEEMVRKTIYRAAYSDITIDSKKIDDDFINLSTEDIQAEIDYEENANSEAIDFDQGVDHDVEIDKETGELKGHSKGSEEEKEKKTAKDPAEVELKPSF